MPVEEGSRQAGVREVELAPAPVLGQCMCLLGQQAALNRRCSKGWRPPRRLALQHPCHRRKGQRCIQAVVTLLAPNAKEQTAWTTCSTMVRTHNTESPRAFVKGSGHTPTLLLHNQTGPVDTRTVHQDSGLSCTPGGRFYARI